MALILIVNNVNALINRVFVVLRIKRRRARDICRQKRELRLYTAHAASATPYVGIEKINFFLSLNGRRVLFFTPKCPVHQGT